jgi:hypothetical protein
MESLNGEELVPGMKVWVDMPHMSGVFPGDVMLALVIENQGQAEAGEIWVRQLPTPRCPIVGETWISRQECRRCLAV